MDFLIIGGTGVISSGLVEELIKRRHTVTCITRGNSKYRRIKEVEYIDFDIRLNEVMVDLKKQYDYVIDCIVYNLPQLKKSIDLFNKYASKYVFISTDAVLWDTEWSYSKNKRECEDYLKRLSFEAGLKYIIIRPGVTYGKYRVPCQIATRKPGWTFFKRMLDGKPMMACKDAKTSLMHISDFARNSVDILEGEKAINQTYTISTPHEEYSWDQIMELLFEIVSVTPFVVHVPVDILREFYPQIYDEMKYSKTINQVIDEREIENRVKSYVNIGEGLEDVYDSMKREFYDNNLKTDIEWECLCDLCIAKAFLSGELNSEEANRMNEYYDRCHTTAEEIVSRAGKILSDIKESVIRKKVSDFYEKENLCGLNDLVIYGYGKLGKEFVSKYKEQVKYVIDNNCKESGVYSFEDIKQIIKSPHNYNWIVISGNYSEEIKKTIISYYGNIMIKILC